MISRFTKISVLTLGICALACWGQHQLSVMQKENETGTEQHVESARLLSLGTPLKVDLPDKSEKPVIINDPSIQKNWGLMGTGGASDIRAASAWNITQGDRNIVVAVIDTGIDVNHPDLRENLWKNPGETGKDSQGRDKASNGFDDDGNGYVDDVYGYDFVNNRGINDVKGNTEIVKDHHGHGTHVAGIIGAVGGNGIGISGVCPKVSLMILKYFDPQSKNNDNLKNTVRAVRYAVSKSANIINYSGGGTEPNDDEREAIQLARDKGVLFVAAAGNERSNSDTAHYYPADYNLDNIISVTAINPQGQVLASSNYGVKSVHIAAPGEGIYSTLPDNAYGFMTGTSQATGFVTGVAALILAHNHSYSFTQVRKQILSTADEVPSLRDKTMTSGKLNSYAALAIHAELPASDVIANDPRPVNKAALFNESRSMSAQTSALRSIMHALAQQPRKQASEKE